MIFVFFPEFPVIVLFMACLTNACLNVFLLSLLNSESCDHYVNLIIFELLFKELICRTDWIMTFRLILSLNKNLFVEVSWKYMHSSLEETLSKYTCLDYLCSWTCIFIAHDCLLLSFCVYNL